MNKRLKRENLIICIVSVFLALLSIPVILSYADSNLLTPGSNNINAGDKYTFKVNLDELKEEYNQAGKGFTVKVTISPDPESVSISPSVSVHQFGSSYTISSSDITNVSSINFTVYTPSDIATPTTYSVSVTVAGEGSTPSGSCSFTVMPQTGTPGKGGMNGKISFGSGSSSGSASVVYEGSWDNYLETLSVQGYEFTQKFNKTRDTYFVNVPKDVKKLTVKAKASDSSAKVRIVGQDNIEKENSKILISVTADNGDVRYYRIYVTHNTEAENE